MKDCMNHNTVRLVRALLISHNVAEQAIQTKLNRQNNIEIIPEEHY